MYVFLSYMQKKLGHFFKWTTYSRHWTVIHQSWAPTNTIALKINAACPNQFMLYALCVWILFSFTSFLVHLLQILFDYDFILHTNCRNIWNPINLEIKYQKYILIHSTLKFDFDCSSIKNMSRNSKSWFMTSEHL